MKERLTCVVTSAERKDWAWKEEEDHEHPVCLEDGLASDDPRDVVPHLNDKEVKDDFQQRDREDDEGLSEVFSSLLAARERGGPQRRDLDCHVAQDRTSTGGHQGLQRYRRRKLDVAPPIGPRPVRNVVVVPCECVGEMVEVHEGTRDDQGRACELTASAEKLHRHQTCYDGRKVQYASADDVEKLACRGAVVAANVFNSLLKLHIEGLFECESQEERFRP